MELTQEQKLQKIIERAKNNGWKDDIIGCEVMFGDAYDDWWIGNNHYYMFVFSIPFLAAYFGTSWPVEGVGTNREVEMTKQYLAEAPWQYHAKILAITPEEERISYLYRFVE